MDKSYHNESHVHGWNGWDEWFFKRAQLVSDALLDWWYMCEQLAAYNTRDDHLDLRFVCDASIKGIAMAFLYPLKALPRLKALAIQMGPFYKPAVHRLVTEMIREKTKLQPSRAPFRFFDLPVELQYRILEYTDLVCPLRYEYCSDRGAFVARGLLGAPSSEPRKEFCPGHAVLPCLRTPHMPSLANRSMRDLARTAFYSHNIFEVDCKGTRFLPASKWSARESRFLKYFPRHSFHYLRHIYWRLPYDATPNRFQPGTADAENWVTSLYLISLTVPPDLLTIKLVMHLVDSYLLQGSKGWTDEQWEYYDRVVARMDCLKGFLKDLFIHIGYPAFNSMSDTLNAQEKALEQSIMGSSYENSTRGKPDMVKLEKYWGPV